MKLMKKRCYLCGGTGTIICRRCNGRTYSDVERYIVWGDSYLPEGHPTYIQRERCSQCHETGKEECPRCEGKGEIMLNSEEDKNERLKYNKYKLYKRFYVNPITIDRDIFKKERYYPTEEWVRQTILEAFDEMDNDPKKYAKPFETMNMIYDGYEGADKGYKTIEELVAISNILADMADWVQQSLEWAQIISNGKIDKTEIDGWDYLCADKKKVEYAMRELIRLRIDIKSLVIWKNGYVRYSGGGLSHPPGIIYGGDRPFKENIPFCFRNSIGTLVVKYMQIL